MTATAAIVAVERPARRGRALGARVVALAAVPVVLVAVWWLVATLANSTVIVGPGEAFGQVVELLGSPRYQSNLIQTAQTVGIAFFFAVVIGGVVGFLLGIAPFWMRAVSPILQAIYSVPKVTIFPVFLALLGFGLATRASFAFFQSVFPMIIIVMGATAHLRSTDIYLKLGASLGMSFPQLVRTILLPAVAPSFLTATRMTFGLTFLGAILAEMFASNGGLGDELVRNMHLVRIDRILGQVVLIGVFALIPNAILRFVEVRLGARLSGDVSRP